MISALVAATLIGQCSTSYGGARATIAQAAPSYGYAQQVRFVAVEQYQDPYYASLVGGRVRAELKRASLEDQLAKLAASVDRLTALAQQPPEDVQRFETPRYAAPSPQQAFTPQYAPQSPTKASQQAPPTKGAPYNSAPPPPPVNPQADPDEVQRFDAGEPGADDLTAILGGRCAACHTDGNSPRGEFVLFATDGRLVADAGDLFRAQRAVDRQLMPKGRPLSQDEAERLGEAIAGHLSQASR